MQNEESLAEQGQPPSQPQVQPVVASVNEGGSSTVIVPTGPQIIQVPIVTSNVAQAHPQQPASFIILQPQFPIVPTLQQPLYVPNGMMHYSSQPPIPTLQPQFAAILPTYICTQDATAASTQPQFTSTVNFS